MQQYAIEQLLGPLNDHEKKHAPEVMWAEGDISLLHLAPRISVIGTRRPSSRGVAWAGEFSRKVAAHGGVVVSGLALGVDTIAHQAAIEAGGKTIAVLGTPIDRISPAQNRRLAEEIARHHLLLSQFPPGAQVARWNFPQRNRTMALISHVTVIVEAADKSGTHHQAWEAIRLRRDLYFADWLLKRDDLTWIAKLQEYGAKPVRDAEEILEQFPPFNEAEFFDADLLA